ncbi:MAG TPA: hypothetical protein VF485_03580 [Sphingomonas sp.]
MRHGADLVGGMPGWMKWLTTSTWWTLDMRASAIASATLVAPGSSRGRTESAEASRAVALIN